MCKDDSFCRCDLEDAEKKRAIERAVKLLKDEGYKVLSNKCEHSLPINTHTTARCGKKRDHAKPHQAVNVGIYQEEYQSKPRGVIKAVEWY